MKKMLITGNPFSWNLGTMALTVSAIKNIQSLEHSSNIFFYKGSVEKNKDIERFSKYFSSEELAIFGFNKGKIPMPLASMILLAISFPYYLKSDLIIDNPGETSRDTWFFSQFSRFLMAKILFKKFIVYGVTVGPFKYKLTKFLAKAMYNSCYKLFIREPVSIDYLRKLEVKTGRMELVCDHAFLLDFPDRRRQEKIKREYTDRWRPFIGISVKYPYDKKDKYSLAFVTLISYIHQNEDRNILLVPHSEEDKKLSRIILSRIKNKRIDIIEEDFSPGELKYIISQADMFIGSRIHACIAAWSSGVPTIVFIPKIDHRSIGMSKVFGLEEYVVDPGLENEKELVEVYKRLSINKNKIKNILNSEKPKIKKFCLKAPKFLMQELSGKL